MHEKIGDTVEEARSWLGNALTEHHARLLDVCLKREPPRPLPGNGGLNGACLSRRDLQAMAAMVEHEVLAGLEKDRKGTDEARKGASGGSGPDPPRPFDVCLMEATLAEAEAVGDPRAGGGSHNHLAACVPARSRDRTSELVWYDGGTSVWDLDGRSHKWRVASLSGPARVLQALEPDNMDLYPLMKDAMKRRALVDVVEDAAWLEQTHGSVVANLNTPQRQAVATVLSRNFESGFLAIQGPPGTGKSTVLTAMIAVLGSGVLVAAPSNAAVANVALKAYLALRDRFEPLDFVVFGENCDPAVHFLSPRLRGERFEQFVREYEGAKETSQSRADSLKRDFVQWLHLDESKEYTVSELGQLCPFIDPSGREGMKRLSQFLTRAKVTFSTLNSAGSQTLRRNLSAHTLLLDEAGQCPEAEFYIAATVPGIRRIVAVGDPKQLPTTVVEPECERRGYGISWLGNIHKHIPEKVHLLSIQYRMDPFILDFPNSHFYDGKIMSATTVFDRPMAEHPFQFIDTCGLGCEEMVAFSWTNAYELATITHLLRTDPDVKLIATELLKQNVTPQIIVISPYKAQVSLLKERLRAPKGCELNVVTVDSVQGQEAHMVIMSTVRTRRVGFTDSPERINVALTRAMIVLRVIGDIAFFSSLEHCSTLRALAEFASVRGKGKIKRFDVNPGRWAPPNWNVPMLWKACMSARFQACLRKFSVGDRNLFMNTLHAVACANESALSAPITERAAPAWYTSSLKSYRELQIVWKASEEVAKPTDSAGSIAGTITAEFAGTRTACLKFLQITNVPQDARIVCPGLTALESLPRDESAYSNQSDARRTHASHLVWKVTEATQQAVIAGDSLPLEGVQLDPFQVAVAEKAPPLLIESRSGTGKTLILVQHAAYFSTQDDEDESQPPACFVTVSPRLCTQLERKYRELSRLENLRLPNVMFYSFDDLLERLLQCRNIRQFWSLRRCSYLAFERSRASHEKLPVDSRVAESEIGGVITGSLKSANEKRPLSREEYYAELRSNVSRDDVELRKVIYDCFEMYQRWKTSTDKYDTSDVVLKLLQENWEDWKQLFEAALFVTAYLDEVQDLSYAAVKLLCTIAGRENAKWVCAGDPAQMITPGCSFTFDGLKQTLRSIVPGIDRRLSEVTQLLVNYRTSRDVLVLANELLSIAKKNFPNDIPFSRKETAKKDYGFRVVLCGWRVAVKAKVRPGTMQAFIYSSSYPEEVKEKAEGWIGEHPFILSSLQSKGLEFDDVLVAFDFDRKTWDVSRSRVACLNMLRELYVAITRAKRRVVILVNEEVPAMMSFFENLLYDFQKTDLETVLQEFNKVTTAEEWFERGQALFKNENYEVAQGCFHKATALGWHYLARGMGLERNCLYDEAAAEFASAIPFFAQEQDHERVLQIGLQLAKPSVSRGRPLDEKAREFIDDALCAIPRYLKRSERVKLALATGKWDRISVDDLKESTLAHVFLDHADNPQLQTMVEIASDDDRLEIEYVLPQIVAQYHMESGNVVSGIRAYLRCSDLTHAIATTEEVIKHARSGVTLAACSLLPAIVDVWEKSDKCPAASSEITKLIALFHSPREAATSQAASGQVWLRLFGRRIIIAAVDADSNEDRTLLHDFDSQCFTSEVVETLTKRFQDDLVGIVAWFLTEKKDVRAASEYAEKKLKVWKPDDFVKLFALFASSGLQPPLKMYTELQHRNGSSLVVLKVIGCPAMPTAAKVVVVESFGKSKAIQMDATSLVAAATWCLDDVQSEPSRRQKSSRTYKQKTDDSIGLFASKLMGRWPSSISTSTASARSVGASHQSPWKEDLFTSSFCASVLAAVADSVDASATRKLLDFCCRSNNGHKATVALFAIAVKHRYLTLALSLPASCLKLKAKKYDSTLSSILDTMLQDGCEVSHSDVALQWNATLVEVALRVGHYDKLVPCLDQMPPQLMNSTMSLLSDRGVDLVHFLTMLAGKSSDCHWMLLAHSALQVSKQIIPMLRHLANQTSLVQAASASAEGHLNDDLSSRLSQLCLARRPDSAEPLHDDCYWQVRDFGPSVTRFGKACIAKQLHSEGAEELLRKFQRHDDELNAKMDRVRKRLESRSGDGATVAPHFPNTARRARREVSQTSDNVLRPEIGPPVAKPATPGIQFDDGGERPCVDERKKAWDEGGQACTNDSQSKKNKRKQKKNQKKKKN